MFGDVGSMKNTSFDARACVLDEAKAFVGKRVLFGVCPRGRLSLLVVQFCVRRCKNRNEGFISVVSAVSREVYLFFSVLLLRLLLNL